MIGRVSACCASAGHDGHDRPDRGSAAPDRQPAQGERAAAEVSGRCRVKRRHEWTSRVSATGAGGLSSDPRPVAANPRELFLSRVRDARPKGGETRQRGSSVSRQPGPGATLTSDASLLLFEKLVETSDLVLPRAIVDRSLGWQATHRVPISAIFNGFATVESRMKRYKAGVVDVVLLMSKSGRRSGE
jgi:hypothetical protein